ncbi:hypothetical protein ACFV6F_27560 [Kitasatospora phosalacinea]|uniref:hypothetical protein n=1 Tax=Kitasatospora phosalacinea TaxID=2065 RepID=UPI00366691EB
MRHRPLITSVTAGVSGTALALGGAPWPLTVGAFGCVALGLLVVALQSVFPQESAHRLAWWRALWRHRQQRRQIPSAVSGAGPSDESPDR